VYIIIIIIMKYTDKFELEAFMLNILQYIPQI
jgi:hypothetical protein